MADQRTALRRRHTAGQREIRVTIRLFKAALQENRILRVLKVGEEIELVVAAD